MTPRRTKRGLALATAMMLSMLVAPNEAACKRAICGLLPVINCDGVVALDDAENACIARGGQLCSLRELKKAKLVRADAREFTCESDDALEGNLLDEFLWTSTTCKRRGVMGNKAFRHQGRKTTCETAGNAALYFACCGEKSMLSDKTGDESGSDDTDTDDGDDDTGDDDDDDTGDDGDDDTGDDGDDDNGEDSGDDDEDSGDDASEEDIEASCAELGQNRTACQAEPLCVFYFAREPKAGTPYGCHAAQTYCGFDTADQCASRCNNWRCHWVAGKCQRRTDVAYPAVAFDTDLEDAENLRCAVLSVGVNTTVAGVACEADAGCKLMCDRCRARPRSTEKAEAATKKKPHIILSLADDLGWNDLGYQNEAIDTPTLDGLVAKGVKLTRHYQYRFCSPSRSMMLTGMFAWRYGQQTDINMNPYNSLRCGLQNELTILPELLKAAGYATHLVGKWHLGSYQTRFLPTNRGFDSFVGYLGGVQGITVGEHEVFSMSRCSCPGEDVLRTCGWDAFTNCATAQQLFNATAGADLLQVPREAYIDTYDYADMLFADEAARVIASHDLDSGPLFLHTAWDSPHNPHESPARFMATCKIDNSTCALRTRRKLAGMVNALDVANKIVLDALEARGMWDDTVFIFASDNGGNNEGKGTDYCPETYTEQKVGSNYPLRGSKFTFWEGGIRTLAFVSGGALPASVRGSVYAGLMSSTDWFRTILDAAGLATTRAQDGLDSESHWDALVADGETASPREVIPVQIWSAVDRHVLIANVDGSLVKLLKGYPGYLTGLEWLRPSSKSRRQTAWDDIHLPEELDVDAHPEAAALAAAPRFLCESRPCVFNLTADPSETVDLSGDAALVARMEALLAPYLATEIDFDRSGLCKSQGTKLLFDTRAISQARRCGAFAPWLPRDPLADPEKLACPEVMKE